MNYRRFATLKIAAHTAADEGGLAAVWRAKRAERPGTPFPVELPTDALLHAGYVVVEDVAGARLDELLTAGLVYSDAHNVLAFLDSLAPA